LKPTCFAVEESPTMRARSKLFHDRIEVTLAGTTIVRHERTFTERAIVIDPLHVLALLERKHRAAGEATAISQWRLPAAFHELRESLRREVRKPDQEWISVLRLMETHPMAVVELAVRHSLERGSARLQTVRMLLRLDGEEHQRSTPIELTRHDLAVLQVAAPNLEAWDALHAGGKP
jgi:hypothetical protein